jgi:hypothetical protein
MKRRGSRTEKHLCSQPNRLKKRDYSAEFYGIMLQIAILPDESPVKLYRRHEAISSKERGNPFVDPYIAAKQQQFCAALKSKF